MIRPTIRIENASNEDLEAIRMLLADNGLPTADLARSRPWLIVAREGPDIVGAGGLETFGHTGLLRSIAVRSRLRGSGLGRALVNRLESRARGTGLSELVLLTETAKGFFENLGYRSIERSKAPQAVQDSEEFRSLCPQSASCLTKWLVSQ